MKRSLLLTVLLMSVTCSVARADWHHWCDRFWCEAELNNRWPYPYRCMDREATAAPFELMKDRGWQLENTLVDELFTVEHELTFAGKLRVRHILLQTPPQRHSIFVMRATTPRMTEKRIQVVQHYAAEIALDGVQPPVMVTDYGPRGGSGAYLDQINRRHQELLPPPVLPAQGGESGGGDSEN